MTLNLKLSYPALLLCLIFMCHFTEGQAARATTGSAPMKPPACSVANIVITQARTGNIVEGKPEYQVTVSNRCRCSQLQVTTRCYGLSSVLPVDPRAIKTVDDELCVINGGRPVAGGGQVRFRYAWMTPQDFPIVSSQIKC